MTSLDMPNMKMPPDFSPGSASSCHWILARSTRLTMAYLQEVPVFSMTGQMITLLLMVLFISLPSSV